MKPWVGDEEIYIYIRRRVIDAKPFKIGTLNIGRLAGKRREVVNVLKRRELDVLCLQEAKFKGSKAREM